MIYELKISFRYCEMLGMDWDMIDSIRALSDKEIKDIEDKMIEHTENSGITWDQEEVHPDGKIIARRKFIKIPDKIYTIEDTPLTKTVYIQVKELPNMLLGVIKNGKARYDIV